MSLIEINFKSQEIIKAVRVSVMLPCDDDLSCDVKPPYKTLYFLNYYSGNSSELLTTMNFRVMAQTKGIAVVIIEGENSYYIDRPKLMANYSRYVMEVVELTRRYFPMLSTRREDTFIAGASMGGWGAMYNGIRYHETFGKIAAMSPMIHPFDVREPYNAYFSDTFAEQFFGPKNEYYGGQYDITRVIRDANENGTLPELFVCCGEQDDMTGYMVFEFVDDLKKDNIPGTYVINEGIHKVTYWSPMLKTVFEFLEGSEK